MAKGSVDRAETGGSSYCGAGRYPPHMINNISPTMMTRPAAASPGRTAIEPPGAAAPVQPSVVVSLSGASGTDAAATYPRPSMPFWRMHSDDAVTMRIARQYDVE